MLNSLIDTMFKKLLLTGLLLFPLAGLASAAQSTAAPVPASLQGAKGVLLRVPINAKGQEYTKEAEMRLYTGIAEIADAGTDASTITEAWNESTPINADEVVAPDDARFANDSSSSGWGWRWAGSGFGSGFSGHSGYGYRHGYYRGYGYPYAPYYYGSYRPYLRYGGMLGRFLRPISWSIGGYGHRHFGHRYYYYRGHHGSGYDDD